MTNQQISDHEIARLLSLDGAEIKLEVTRGARTGIPIAIRTLEGKTVADVRYSTTKNYSLAPLIAAAPDLQSALRETYARALAAEAEVERLRAALDATVVFTQMMIDLADVDPDETTFTFRVMPEGRMAAVRTLADTLAEARAALKETDHD